MALPLQNTKVAFLATDGVEQVEYIQPRQAVEDAGAQVELISIKEQPIQGFNHLDKGDTFPVDKLVRDANPDDYEALVLPGGVGNPDRLRMNPEAVQFVRAFFDAGKPVGAICHAPWTMIDAEVVNGRTITSYRSLRTDLTNAGARWVDEQVHTDNGLVTSRGPQDLPAFCSKIVEEFAEGRHPAGHAA